MQREVVQKVFNRDFRQLLGVDIFEVIDDLEYQTSKKWWKETVPETIRTPFSLFTINVLHIVEDFLTYDDIRFPNPIDQYIHIYENRDTILTMLECNLSVDSPFDDPIAYDLCIEYKARFERLFTGLLTCGKTHKFDPEIIMLSLERDPDEQD